MSGPNTWEILTAIGTLGAVVVALFLPMWQARRRLSVQVATPGGYKRDKTISVVMTNSGGKVVTVVRVLTKGKGGKPEERFESGNTPTLPHTLRSGDFISLTFPYITSHLAEVKDILVEDSLGKLWRCDAKSHRAALSIQGEKRRLFSHGKEFDEWAEKNKKK
ncbi:MAG: hypothetical protein ABSB63_02165 [Spirochaetia bacterium]|jgi:hypothetical protein